MTEDDTFNALRRTPFLAIVKLVSDCSGAPQQKIISMWNSCHLDIVKWNGPSEKWAQIYEGHGWTFEELIEATKHVK